MMDALDRLLELARAEAAWSADGFAAFAEGLRERAGLVLAERVAPLEERIRALERSVASLERECAWREQTAAGLAAEVAGLKGEAQALRAARDTAAESHEKLLAHHRQVVAHAVERLRTAAGLSAWKLRERRALLEASAALFARELP